MGSKLSTQSHKNAILNQDNTTFCLHNERCESNIKEGKTNYNIDLNPSHDQLTECLHATKNQCYVQSDDTKGTIIGNHETQESESGEADLHTYLVNCKKNPGHKQFIPVDTFAMKHLPEGYQDKDLYEYIKVLSELTVRVSVLMSSPHRPMFWPKTTQPFPFYNMSDTRNLRTGSGSVWKVKKFHDGVRQDGCNGRTDYTKCWCRKCQDLDSPSNVWWEFKVTTAIQVVFDDIEASQTTLRLFYDRNDSLEVSVDKVKVDYVNIEYDLCMLNCVTCDENLGNKLLETWKHFFDVSLKVSNKYFDNSFNQKLNVIVSHPHGCSKQVSVGQWKEKLEVGDLSKFTYTTCTCPGSSGAFVYCLGLNDVLSEIVHSGSLNSGLNYSGSGYI
ncbi:hypothetical protein BgiBS90_000254 [Biomphalaria glabrata]|nr:hypothetical protein BgiBS90_000254 [Biomphalaria glabrata]